MGGVSAAIRMGFLVEINTVSAVRTAAPRKMTGEGSTPTARLSYSVDTVSITRGRVAFPTKKPISRPKGMPMPESQSAWRLMSSFTCFLLMPMVRYSP